MALRDEGLSLEGHLAFKGDFKLFCHKVRIRYHFCNGVLHHTSDPYGGFRNLVAITRAGGLFTSRFSGTTEELAKRYSWLLGRMRAKPAMKRWPQVVSGSLS